MTWLILGFCALLSVAAGENPYGDRYSVGFLSFVIFFHTLITLVNNVLINHV